MISFMGRGKGLRVGKGFIGEGRRRKRRGERTESRRVLGRKGEGKIR